MSRNLFTNGGRCEEIVHDGINFVCIFTVKDDMTSETVIDPLQLVPHRIKALKLIYDQTYRGATAADDRTGYVSTRSVLFSVRRTNKYT